MTAIRVNVDNFARAETARMLAAMQTQAGGVNQWNHSRGPTPLDRQTVIRMNRDTFYSMAVVDLAEGATWVMPDAGSRYMSAMVVNENHHLPVVIHGEGEHHLSEKELGSRYVLVGVRTLANPTDAQDVAAVNALQDQLRLTAASSVAFQSDDYDGITLDATREGLLELAKGLGGFEHAFGAPDAVDPVRHLIGTASGWGGLPEQEAYYVNVNPGLAVGEYRLTVRDVPVDGFWSISLYNEAGFFEPGGTVSVNNLTATRDPDGSISVHFGGCADGRPNCLPIMEGWNYVVRLYRPRPEILDGSWSFPEVTAYV